MSPRKEEDIIRIFDRSHLDLECPFPDCSDQFLINNAGLFYLKRFSIESKKIHTPRLQELVGQKKTIREMHNATKHKSQVQAQTSNISFIVDSILYNLLKSNT